ncbi:MAG TPA: ChbG/HpnK family deacetylase [Flavobacteriales bacterium]
MPRRIIINADDLGLSPSVNTAIFDVFRAGNLTSATLMVNMPGTTDAVARLKDHPGLAIGLHFCITEGRALTGPSSLTDATGLFRTRSELARMALRGKVHAADVQREFSAQLDRLRSFGISPTHTDSHQHVHMMPAVLNGMLPALKGTDLALRLVDPPASAVRGSLGRPPKALKQWLNRRFARQARRRTTQRTNDALVSIHDLDHAGPYDASTYRGLLKAVPEDALVEVMVHPYILGADVLDLYAVDPEAKRPFLQRCLAEYEALRGNPVFEGMELVSFAAA